MSAALNLDMSVKLRKIFGASDDKQYKRWQQTWFQ